MRKNYTRIFTHKVAFEWDEISSSYNIRCYKTIESKTISYWLRTYLDVYVPDVTLEFIPIQFNIVPFLKEHVKIMEFLSEYSYYLI